MNTVKEEFWYLDVLVNNAVKEVSRAIEDLSFEERQLAINSKLNGSWLCTKYALPLLKKSDDANIIVISSSADERPSPDIWSYAVATGAVNCFVKALAAHMPNYGIRVNAVMPSQVRTAHWGSDEKNDKLWKTFKEFNPMKRLATPEIVADAVVLLVNDPHKYFNGNFLYVNGGGHWK
ncbi:MAG TPA: SDR family oxidoreductase [Candidatus Dojkabacteria bacterium]|nr:SDR family oxidoreductase [Candidatus Dojkabacteria bacterium]